MSVYCIECGTAYDGSGEYCAFCGESNQIGEQTESSRQLNPPVYNHSQYYSVTQTRNPLQYVIGSILIPFFIYIYAFFNFKDMKRLNKEYHQDSTEDQQNPKLMLFLFIIFPPATIYFKFNQLHNHLTQIHNETPSIPDGSRIILNHLGGMLLIFAGFLFIIYNYQINFLIGTGLVTVAFAIHLAYPHYKWQKAFNSHIINHQYLGQAQ